jgi:hypothetical protein
MAKNEKAVASVLAFEKNSFHLMVIFMEQHGKSVQNNLL